MTTTVVDSLTDVFPTDDPNGASSANLVAARNEFESFQIVVTGEDGSLANVDVAWAGDLTGPGGAEIPVDTSTLYKVEHYRALTASDTEGGTGLWPDPLVPRVDYFYGEARNRFPFDVPQGENGTVWVDVFVPTGIPEGTYGGAINVTADGHTDSVTVSVEVLDFDLPSTSTVRSAFWTTGEGWKRPCQAHQNNQTCGGNEDERWRLQGTYARAGLENRISMPNPMTDVGNPPPVTGAARNGFEDHVLPLMTGTDPVGQQPLRLPGAELTAIGQYAYAGWHCTSEICLDGWVNEAATSGFSDRLVLYGCDEPNTAGKFEACEAQHGNYPEDVPVLVTATIDDATAYATQTNTYPGDYIDILVPVTRKLHGKPGPEYPGNQRANYDAYLDDPVNPPANQAWIYTACGSFGCGSGTTTNELYDGWSGYAIDAPPSQSRATPWLTYTYDLDGELYWGTFQSLHTAWNAGGQFWDGANGDGTLFYPGRACAANGADPSCIGGETDIPIESIRLKRLRDGYEDAEYLHWLDGQGRDVEASTIANGLFSSTYDTTKTATEVLAARAQLIVEIQDVLS